MGASRSADNEGASSAYKADELVAEDVVIYLVWNFGWQSEKRGKLLVPGCAGERQ